jgi:hypothetical protein
MALISLPALLSQYHGVFEKGRFYRLKGKDFAPPTKVENDTRNEKVMSSNPEARQFTTEEIRYKFIEHVQGLVQYWGKQEGSPESKLSGLAFSLLVLLDGGTGGFPRFIVAPYPHPTDREFLKSEGENWFPENHELQVQGDIGGGLHDYLRNNPKPETL